VYQNYEKRNEKGQPKPEGFPYELADAVIRIMHWFGSQDLDLAVLIKNKLAYNLGRPHRHGDKVT
jgi:hypothetical protein